MQVTEGSAFHPTHWIVLTAAGLAGGLAAGAALGTVPLVIGVIGVVLGAFQAFGLRRLLPKPLWWIAATMIGVGVGMALGVVLVQEIGILLTGLPLRIAQLSSAARAVSFVTVGLVAGTVVGIAQWMVLRTQRPAIKHWIVVCAAALAVAFCLASLFVDVAGIRYASGIGRFSFLLFAGLLFGSLTSWPLRRGVLQTPQSR